MCSSQLVLYLLFRAQLHSTQTIVHLQFSKSLNKSINDLTTNAHKYEIDVYLKPHIRKFIFDFNF